MSRIFLEKDAKNPPWLNARAKDFHNEKLISPLFVTDEEFIGEYQSVRDFVVFTNKRVIAVNVQGVTGKKKDFTILPYSKIQLFSIETSGVLDIDSELELYFSSVGKSYLNSPAEAISYVSARRSANISYNRNLLTSPLTPLLHTSGT